MAHRLDVALEGFLSGSQRPVVYGNINKTISLILFFEFGPLVCTCPHLLFTS